MKFSLIVTGAFTVLLVSTGVHAKLSEGLLSRVRNVFEFMNDDTCTGYAKDQIRAYSHTSIADDDNLCTIFQTDYYKKTFQLSKCTDDVYYRVKDAVCGDSDGGSHAKVSEVLLSRLNKVVESFSAGTCRNYAKDLLDSYRKATIPDSAVCTSISNAKDSFNVVKCTDDQYNKVKDAVCGASGISISIMTTAFCLIANVFRKM